MTQSQADNSDVDGMAPDGYEGEIDIDDLYSALDDPDDDSRILTAEEISSLLSGADTKGMLSEADIPDILAAAGAQGSPDEAAAGAQAAPDEAVAKAPGAGVPIAAAANAQDTADAEDPDATDDEIMEAILALGAQDDSYGDLDDVNVDDLLSRLNSVVSEATHHSHAGIVASGAAGAALAGKDGGPGAKDSAPAGILKKLAPANILKAFAVILPVKKGLFTAKRIAILAVAVTLCSAAGYMGVRIYAGSAGKGAGDQAPQVYVPSDTGYRLSDFVHKKPVEAESDGETKGVSGGEAAGGKNDSAAGGKNDSAAGSVNNSASAGETGRDENAVSGDEDAKGTAAVDIVNMLYPIQELMTEGYYYNHVKTMADRIGNAGAAEIDSVSHADDFINHYESVKAADAAGQVETVKSAAAADAEGKIADMAGDEGSTSEQASVKPLHVNPVVETRNPFPVNVLTFKQTEDILITGHARVTNNTGMHVENLFLEIILDYGLVPETESKATYSYNSGVDLAPGDTKTISFAAIPPVKGDGRFTLNRLLLAAFDTNVGGEAKRVYYDTENSFLEVLSVGAY